jgi:alpha-L-rhamnosidase
LHKVLIMKSLFSVLLMFLMLHVNAQMIPDPDLSPDLLKKHWDASWINYPDKTASEFGVYLFRNTFELSELPGEFIIHLSADNRYKLYVNEQWVGLGPARSDADNWIFETYDIAEYLEVGKNNVSVEVWNYGEYRPWAQISLGTGLIVQGNTRASAILNTPGNWKCLHAEAYSAFNGGRDELGTFIVVGPGLNIDGSIYPWGWRRTDYNDITWKKPRTSFSGAPQGVGTDITHALVPRTIPAMELRQLAGPIIRKAEGIDAFNNNPAELKDLTVPKNMKKVNILLDQQKLLTAYPELIISGGKGAKIRIGYAESLFDSKGSKPHRDSIEGMTFKGAYDLIEADGGKVRLYTTLWFRTFRYIHLEISTMDDPLTIHGMNPVFTAYPFEEKASFRADNEIVLEQIWDLAWHTSRLCANELFYDCPYYEQMQYVGDTRIQALIALYVSGDDRLMKKAINDYYNSINPEGLTLSRYPTEPRQIIPTYSLAWVSMIYDYLLHRNDYEFVAKYLLSIQGVLQWFEARKNENGMLGGIEYWPFVDWTDQWPWDNELRIGGVPPGGIEGNSSIISFQYAMTLRQAAEIFRFYGVPNIAKTFENQASAIIEATRKFCWDEEKGLFADTPEKESYSQHASSLAILCDAVPEEDQALLMERVMRDETLIQASLYFRFYVHQAAIKAGLGNKYLTYLDSWKQVLGNGMTTLPEIPDLERTRSDCHAWSSSPVYEFLATVTGIKPAAMGFEAVIIEPHPNGLKHIEASMPHHKGDIGVDLKFDNKGGVAGTVKLPDGLKGLFIWDGQTLDLEGGKQSIKMSSMDARFVL